MALLNRIGKVDSEPGVKIRGHHLESALILYFQGGLQKADLVNQFGITAEDLVDFDRFKTKYDSFPKTDAGSIDQLKWQHALISCFVLIQNKVITNAQFNTFLGLSLTE